MVTPVQQAESKNPPFVNPILPHFFKFSIFSVCRLSGFSAFYSMSIDFRKILCYAKGVPTPTRAGTFLFLQGI